MILRETIAIVATLGLGCAGELRVPLSIPRPPPPERSELEPAEALDDEPDPEPVPPAPMTPEPTLADRALAWAMTRVDGPFRFNATVARNRASGLEDWVRAELVPAAVAAADGAVFPERWPDAPALLAKSWWESRWRPNEVGGFVVVNGRAVRGRGGELGVMQIKPRICARYLRPGEDCADTRVNLRIAATILREHLATCGAGRHRQALRRYATGRGCAPPRYAEKTVTIWAEQLRAAR